MDIVTSKVASSTLNGRDHAEPHEHQAPRVAVPAPTQSSKPVTYLRALGKIFTHFLQLEADTTSSSGILRIESQLAEVSDEFNALKQHNEQLYQQCCALTRENQGLRGLNDELCHKQTEDEQELKALHAARLGLQNANHDLLQQKQADVTEISKSREEATKYKQVISSLTQVENQVADDEIRSMMDQLYYSIQEFALRTFRGVRFDYSQLPHNTKKWTAAFIPSAATATPELKAYVMVALTWNVMLAAYQPRYFFGMPKAQEDSLAGKAAALAHAFADNAMLKKLGWLENTRKLLVAVDTAALEVADNRLVEVMATEVKKTLSPATQMEWSTKTHQSLLKICAKAAELFRLLYRQKASFDLSMPAAATQFDRYPFDPKFMSAEASDEEEQALEGRRLEMSIFPGLVKHGDESGENMHIETVVSKARVVPQKKKPTSYRAAVSGKD